MRLRVDVRLLVPRGLRQLERRVPAVGRCPWRWRASGHNAILRRAMSQENIEKLRQAYEAFSRGDFDDALTFAHPDIEFFPPGNAAPYRGIERFRAWMEPDAFDRQVIEPLEFIDAGNKVLVKQHVKSRGTGSGIELEGRSWSVWTVNEDGLASEWRAFWSGMRPRPERPPGCRSRRCRGGAWTRAFGLRPHGCAIYARAGTQLAYSASISVAYLSPIGLRFSFIVGVSSSPPAGPLALDQLEAS